MAENVALLLEDEALIAMDVAATLEAEGFSVVRLETSRAAVAWLRENEPPALVIIDIELRDGPCDDVAAILVNRGLPHIVHSAGPSKAEPPFDAGVWLPKPSTTAAMIAAIRSLAVGSTS